MYRSLRVGVASRNPVKVEAVRTVAASIFGGSLSVTSVEAPGGRLAQPLSDEEAIDAARQRARHALGKADYGVGIEGGVMRVGKLLFGCNWAVVAARSSEGIACSARYPLPAELWERLAAGAELSDLIEPGIGARGGAVARVSGGAITRRHLAEEALRLAFGQALHPLDPGQPSPR